MIAVVIVSTVSTCLAVGFGHWLGRTGVNTIPTMPQPIDEFSRRRAAREMAIRRHPAGKGLA